MIKNCLILIIGVLFLVSCTQDVEINSLESLRENISPQSEKFALNPNQDNYIEGKQGTVIFFPSNSFVYDNGKPVEGQVEINLEEYYSISDIISNSLSTLSDSLLLETGGMINIKATSKGKEVKINRSMSYVVCFPKKREQDMGLFYGNRNSDGEINWKLENVANYEDEQTDRINSLSIDSSLVNEYVGISCWSAASTGPNGRNCNFDWNINHKDSTIFKYVKNLYKDSVELEDQMRQSNSRVEMELTLGNDGKIKSISFDSITPFNKRIEKLMYSLPSFKMDEMYCEPGYEYSLCIGVTDYIILEEYLERFDQKYTQYKNNAIEYINKKELDYYVLSATKLDWINCDRFLELESEKVDLFVSVQNQNTSSTILIFKKYNTIMNGTPKNGGFVFNQIPVGEEITILGISYLNGKPNLAKISSNSSKKSFELNNFQTFSLEELKNELNNIN